MKAPTPAQGTPVELREEFKPGLYRHYKGGLYTALMLARDHETRELQVVYVSHKTGAVCVRPYAQPASGPPVDAWTDVVPWPSGLPATSMTGPRFVREGEQPK